MNIKKLSPRNIIISLSMLVALIAACFFAVNWLSDNDDSTSLNKVEDAIFSNVKPNALFYGNVQQTQRLLALLSDTELENKVNTVTSKAPFVEIAASSEVLLKASNFFVSSLGSSGDTSLNDWLTVVQGNYQDLDLKAEISKQYILQDVENNLVLMQLKPEPAKNDFVCPADEINAKEKTQTKIYAYLSDTQIIISSSPSMILGFQKTYSQQTTDFGEESKQLLSQWRDYRQSSLFSISVFDEQLLSKDLTTKIASGALLGDAAYESIGLKGKLNLSKQTLELSFDAGLNDKNTASNLASKIERGIADINRENEKIFPSVTRLLSRISVKADSGLHLGLSLDNEIVPELESVVSDFISIIFKPTISSGDGDNKPQKEVLDEYSWDYALNNKLSQQATLPEDKFQRFLPLTTKRNVSFFIKSLGIKAVSPFDKEQGDALQLSIQAKRPAALGDTFHAWSDSGIKQRLSITKVLDENGKNLLLDERCKVTKFNEELNHQPNESSNYSNGVIENSKNVRLITDDKAPQISKVVGEYSFHAATNIELKDVTLTAPKQTWPGGSFQLNANKHGSISYVFKDKESRLIDVIGLNAAGKALSHSYSFGSDGRYTKQFKGEVATVRLVVAGGFEQENFSFEINSIVPQLKPQYKTEDAFKRVPRPSAARKRQIRNFSIAQSLENLTEKQRQKITSVLKWNQYSLDAKNEHELGKLLTSTGMVFFKHNEQSSWNNKLSGLALFPHSDVLQSLDGLVTAQLKIDGKQMDPVALSIAKSKRGEKIIPTISVDGLELGIATFSVPFDEKRGPINTIEGTLEFMFPTKISVRTFTSNVIDPVIEGLTFIKNDYHFKGAATYKVDEALAKASLIKLTTHDGTEHLGKVQTDKGVTTVELDSLTELAEADFWFIDESEVITEEFKFTPNYK